MRQARRNEPPHRPPPQTSYSNIVTVHISSLMSMLNCWTAELLGRITGLSPISGFQTKEARCTPEARRARRHTVVIHKENGISYSSVSSVSPWWKMNRSISGLMTFLCERFSRLRQEYQHQA